MNGISRTVSACVIGATLTLSTCALAKTPLGNELSLGTARVVENLTIWPVYTNRPIARYDDFVTLEQAEEAKVAQVREKGVGEPAAVRPPVANQMVQQTQRVTQGINGGGATVNQVVIENKGSKPILVLAGTLIKGGKQDRLIGQDFIVPPEKTVAVDAFCVEQGRWTANRAGRNTGGVFKSQKKMAVFGARTKGQHTRDQSEVWSQVAEANGKAAKAPSSGTLMATIDETDAEANARRKRLHDGALEALARHADAVGLAYAIDGEVRELRAFAHPKLFGHYRAALLETIAVEADLAQRAAREQGKRVSTKAGTSKSVVDLIHRADGVEAKRERTKAGNVNFYRKNGDVESSSCFEEGSNDQPVTRQYNRSK